MRLTLTHTKLLIQNFVETLACTTWNYDILTRFWRPGFEFCWLNPEKITKTCQNSPDFSGPKIPKSCHRWRGRVEYYFPRGVSPTPSLQAILSRQSNSAARVMIQMLHQHHTNDHVWQRTWWRRNFEYCAQRRNPIDFKGLGPSGNWFHELISIITYFHQNPDFSPKFGIFTTTSLT